MQLYPQPLYTASQVRTTSRSWDKGGVNRLMPHPVLTDLCLTLYYKPRKMYKNQPLRLTQRMISSQNAAVPVDDNDIITTNITVIATTITVTIK